MISCAVHALIWVLSTAAEHWTTHVVALVLCPHSHLIILFPERRCVSVALMSRARRRQEVDDEAPDVEYVDERNGPFEDCGAVVVALVGHDTEGDGQCKLDKDETELDPEASCEDSFATVADSETLVFGANEDGGDDVGSTVMGIRMYNCRLPIRRDSHENNQHGNMHMRVVHRVEDRE